MTDELTGRVGRLEALVATLVEENIELRARLAEPAPPTDGPSAEATARGGVVDRRSLLTKGLAAAGAATAGAVLLQGEPAAADGQPLIVAGNNWSTAGTRLNVTAPGTDGGLQVVDSGGLPSLAARRPALVVGTNNIPLNLGIYVRSTLTGIEVDADDFALIGRGATTGVLGEGVEHGVVGSSAEVGVTGDSPGGVGVASRAFTNLRLTTASASRNAPTGDTVAHQRGDLVETTAGDLWLCTAAGTPGTWRKVGGPATAGALHVLPTPARVYDSRFGTVPTSVGPKTPFAPDQTRVFDLKANASGVPAGATAALVTLLLVNAANGAGNLTIWANGVAKPQANTLVWGGNAGRFTATAVTALDAQARVRVHASARTDLVIDVVGYYR